MAPTFKEVLAAGYGNTDPSVILGAALESSGTVDQEPKVKIPLAMMNRHGLIAGATGTGKTRTLQLLTDQLSAQGVPVFVADMKGDLSGLAHPVIQTIDCSPAPRTSAGTGRPPQRRSSL